MKKNITLLGATGTIGKNTVSLVKENPDKFQIDTVIANNNVANLVELAQQVNAKDIVIANEQKFTELKEFVSNVSFDVNIHAGKAAVQEFSSKKVDLFVSAAVGFCALEPTMAAIKAGNNIGLANKECLVCAGDLMTKAALDNNSQLLPIDSEHNSIYQVFDFDRADEIDKVILTASGGPFRNLDVKEFSSITPEMAVKHPNWNMGKKISVDSATMMNKGLEVIEAYYLFPVEKSQIDVLVHPQSIIHGLVTYKDGAMLAGLSGPDMRVPISYALAYPERIMNDAGKIDLAEIGNLTFSKPDLEKFKCLRIALDALNEGQTAGIALNAANEVAVEAFLSKKISFLQIADIVEGVIEKIIGSEKNIVDDLNEIFDIDYKARTLAKNAIDGDGADLSSKLLVK